MRHLKVIFGFGWPYLRRYRWRLFAGILLGVLFGISNASFVWATKTLFERLESAPIEASNLSQSQEPSNNRLAADLPSPVDAAAERSNGGRFLALDQLAGDANRLVNQAVDPWLPRLGRTLDWRQIFGGLLFLPVLVAFRGYTGYLSSYCLGWVSERVINDLRLDVLLKLNSLSLDFFNRSTMGDLLTRINGDTASLHRCLSLGFSDLIKEPITILSVFLGLCLIDLKLTLFAVIFLPFCMIPMVVLGRKARRASQAGLTANVSQASQLVEALSNIRVVKAFGLESFQVERFRELSRRLVHFGVKGIQAKELVNPLVETISMLGLGVLIVYIFYTQTSVANLVGFLTGVVIFFTPVKKLAGLHILIQQTRVGVERLLQIFSERPTVQEAAKPVRLREFKTELEFDHVGFSYGHETVLTGINLRIPAGLKLGVAGESGSGKSTLLNLIFRFYDPTQGRIRIDGLDLREASVEDVRNLMALVSQEMMLFDLTVAENIACGKLGARREEIEAAARAAYAHDFICQLPQGYETRIGERGITLSGGQRQRLAIARAFVRDAPILVLDEATAALDAQSEAEVQTAIERLEQNRTVVCVAHRLSTLRNMDTILVLSRGRMVEQGNFEELLASDGLFAAMARRQGLQATSRAHRSDRKVLASDT